MAATENYVPENKKVLDAIDVFYMTFQQANFKGKPKSMFSTKKKMTEKPFFWQSIPDKETGEWKKYKVYY